MLRLYFRGLIYEPGLPARSTIADSHNNLIPNPSRPSNPFTPSEEPDWVVVPTNSTQGWSQQDRPPPPEIIRRLPPPFEANNTARSDAVRDRSDLARKTSLASSGSSSTGVLRKPCPPVPKKPAILSSPGLERGMQRSGLTQMEPGQRPQSSLSETRSIDSEFLPPPPPRRNTGTIRQQPMQQIRKPIASNGGGQGHNSSRIDRSQLDGVIGRPDAPPRPVLNTNPVKALLDEDDGHAGSIPSLLPLRLG